MEGEGVIAVGGDRGMFATVYELVSREHLFHILLTLVSPGSEFGFRQDNDVWCVILKELS